MGRTKEIDLAKTISSLELRDIGHSMEGIMETREGELLGDFVTLRPGELIADVGAIVRNYQPKGGEVVVMRPDGPTTQIIHNEDGDLAIYHEFMGVGMAVILSEKGEFIYARTIMRMGLDLRKFVHHTGLLNADNKGRVVVMELEDGEPLWRKDLSIVDGGRWVAEERPERNFNSWGFEISTFEISGLPRMVIERDKYGFYYFRAYTGNGSKMLFRFHPDSTTLDAKNYRHLLRCPRRDLSGLLESYVGDLLEIDGVMDGAF